MLSHYRSLCDLVCRFTTSPIRLLKAKSPVADPFTVFPPADTSQGSIPPGPSGHWLFGCTKELQRDLMGFAVRTVQEYGHYVRVRFAPGIYMYLLAHPDAVEHVLQKRHQNYRKPGVFTKPLSLLGGNGLFTSNGDHWRRQRKLMQPAFHKNSLALLFPHMVTAIRACLCDLAQTPQSDVADALPAMMKLALGIAGITLFSADISEAHEIASAYHTAVNVLSRRIWSISSGPAWLPTPSNRTFASAKFVLDRFVTEIIAARRAATSRPNDVLSVLLDARDEETCLSMTDRQLVEEAHTLLFAAHETTGASFAWAWYLLAQHPEVQDDLYEEVQSKLAGRDPTAEDLYELPLTRAVYEEVLRLYPPAAGQARQAIEADQINGFNIPANAIIYVSQFVTQRHPDFWDEPERFKPERFLPGGSAGRHKFAYFPFGSGPRVCIGASLALVEGMLVIAMTVLEFRFELAPGQSIRPDATFVLRPEPGVKVILTPRSGLA